MDSSGVVWTVVAGIVLASVLTVLRFGGRRRRPAKHRAAESDSSSERAEESPRAEEPRAEKSPQAEESPGCTDGPTVHDERRQLIEAKVSAEKAYAERVSAAEHEFNAKKNRADTYLRAAEIFLEHAQEYGRGHLGAIRGRQDAAVAWEHELAFDDQALTDASLHVGADTTRDFFLHSRSTLTAPAVNQAARFCVGLASTRGQRIRSAEERLVDAMFEHRSAVAAAEKKLGTVKDQRDDVQRAIAALEAFDAQAPVGTAAGHRTVTGSG